MIYNPVRGFISIVLDFEILQQCLVLVLRRKAGVAQVVVEDDVVFLGKLGD